MEAPLNAKPPCRPVMVVVPASLLTQTWQQLSLVSDFYFVVMASKTGIRPSSNVTIIKTRAELLAGSKDRMAHSVFDPNNQKNLRTVLLISFETLVIWFGETGMGDAHKGKTGMVRKIAPPLNYVYRLQGLIRMLVMDEVHLFLRNQTATYYTVYWIQAPKLRLFSGSPMPRDLSDMGAYLGLLEYQDLGYKAQHDDKDIDYKAGITNPYLLDEDDPRFKFCFTKHCFDRFVAKAKNEPVEETSNHDDSAVGIGQLASKALSSFFIRRDYSSACPNGSEYTISRNMPKLCHHEIHIVYSPSDHNTYQAGFNLWRRRLILQQQDRQGNVTRMPNPRALRALSFTNFMPIMASLHYPNHKYATKAEDGEEEVMEETEEERLERIDKDFNSWFNVDSKLFGETPAPGPNFRMTRWLLDRINNSPSDVPVDIEDLPYQDVRKVSEKKIQEILIAHSPKLAQMVNLLTQINIVQDKRMILWFRHEEMLHIVQEFLESLACYKEKGAVETFVSSMDNEERVKAMARLNDPNSPLKIFLAMVGIGATGHNAQLATSVMVLFDVQDSMDTEIQIIARLWRLGQKHPVHVYSFSTSGTQDQKNVT